MQRLNVGRGPSCDWVLDDRSLSRHHATFQVTDATAGRVTLEDHDSRNGSFVDGQRVNGQASCGPGSIVRLGNSVFAVEQVQAAPTEGGDIIAFSSRMQATLAELSRIAPARMSVLIVGPTGSGKERLAKRLHQASGRRGKMIAVNCAAIPKELAESFFFGHKKGAFTGATADSPGVWLQAHEGTLFLDELAELSIDLQAKLLRLLDNQDVFPLGSDMPIRADVRIVAATNSDLGQAIRDGKFRSDLYARLSYCSLQSEPLHRRRADILPLFRRFFADAGGTLSMSSSFAEGLALTEFPLNARQLQALAQRLALEKEVTLDSAHLPLFEASWGREPTRERLVSLLQSVGGNVARVAEMLGKDRKQVYRWLEKHGIDAATTRKP